MIWSENKLFLVYKQDFKKQLIIIFFAHLIIFILGYDQLSSNSKIVLHKR